MKKILNKTIPIILCLVFKNLSIDYFKTKSYIDNSSPNEEIIELKKDYLTNIYYLDAKINGHELEFILDTGCSCISIPYTKFNYLYSLGVIDDDDLVGTSELTDANGNTETTNMYNIKKFTIGDMVIRNVLCSESNNSESLFLLGQNVLSSFSNVTIDYDEHLLILKK